MSEEKHTPEPWDDTEFVGDDAGPMRSAEDVAVAVAASAAGGGAFLFGATAGGYLDADGRHRVLCYTGNGPASAANSRRIVACVNALAGVPTAAVEAGVVAELVRVLGLVKVFGSRGGTPEGLSVSGLIDNVFLDLKGKAS